MDFKALMGLASLGESHGLWRRPGDWRAWDEDRRAGWTALQVMQAGQSANGRKFLQLVRHLAAGCPALPRPRKRPALRVGFALACFLQGGVERWLLGLLPRLGADIEIRGVWVQGGTFGPMADQIREHCPRMQGRGGLATLAECCDVLVVWGLADGLAELDGYRGRVVFVSHGPGPWTHQAAVACAPHVTDWAAVSQGSADSLPEPGLATILHNGIDLARCVPTRPRDELRRAIGLDDGEIALGYVGRLSEEKRPAAAAIAAATLGLPYRSVYFGEGRQEVAARILQIDPRAIMRPWQEHVGDCLATLDCLVSVSWLEGWGLAIAEAWAAGVPTVVPAGIGNLEIASDRPLSVTVGQDWTAVELATAVRMALGMVGKCRLERARRLILANYTVEAMSARWRDYLLSLEPAK